jgi:hypothetical protein
METLGVVFLVVVIGYALFRHVVDGMTRSCPRCRQRIKHQASVCPFCGQRFA